MGYQESHLGQLWVRQISCSLYYYSCLTHSFTLLPPQPTISAIFNLTLIVYYHCQDYFYHLYQFLHIFTCFWSPRSRIPKPNDEPLLSQLPEPSNHHQWVLFAHNSLNQSLITYHWRLTIHSGESIMVSMCACCPCYVKNNSFLLVSSTIWRRRVCGGLI